MNDAVKAAAKWWADTLRVAPSHDNGADDPLPSMLARTLASGSKPSETQAQKFENVLFSLLMKERLPAFLTVDYGPQGLLLEACDAAGGEDYIEAYLPWKTNMNVSQDKVEVSSGYGAPWKTIYQKEEVTAE